MNRNEASPHHRPQGDVAAADPGGAAARPERQRIAKAMARAGLCSRREAEAWVLAGRVAVNGETLSSPARDVGPDDLVLVDGAPLRAAEPTRLFLFHKPRGLVTSDHDPEGRETVFDFLRENWPEGPRVVTVGRLDINTEGLLLLTNDGGLARVLELPDTGWLRRYRVRAKGATDQARLDALAEGIEIDGIAYAGIEARLDRIQGSNCWLTMGLREGKNREIKRVLEQIGLEVNRLIRLSFGPFQLLDLPEGAVEEVRTRVLRDQLGAALAAQAGVDFGGAQAEPAPARLTLAARVPAPAVPAGQEERQRPPRAADSPRRHVSALRAPEPGGQPRRRTERSATKDRHDRTVAVERISSVEPWHAPRPGRGGSPSAEGKRARVARSGGAGASKPRFGGDKAGRFAQDEARKPWRGARGKTEGGFQQGRDGGERGAGRRTGGFEGAERRPERARPDRAGEQAERRVRPPAGRPREGSSGREGSGRESSGREGGFGRKSGGGAPDGRRPRYAQPEGSGEHGERRPRPPAGRGERTGKPAADRPFTQRAKPAGKAPRTPGAGKPFRAPGAGKPFRSGLPRGKPPGNKPPGRRPPGNKPKR